MREGSRLIALGLVGFASAALIVVPVGLWLVADGTPRAGFAVQEVAAPAADGALTVTLDSSDTEQWRGFSFDLGRVVPEGPAADVLVRRHLLRAPHGAAEVGAVGETPVQWVADSPDGDHRNPALSRWYAYDYLAHQLDSRRGLYAVRTSTGTVYLSVESFLCEDRSKGCLTLRYRHR